MHCKLYFLILILSLFLTSCASNKWSPSEVNEVFVTDIKPSGLKVFYYSLTKTTPQANGSGKHKGGDAGIRDGRGSKGGGHGGMGGRKSDNEPRMKQYFNDMLASKLEKSGYCREGYIELESYFERGRLKIRGECGEGATEDDRIKFVNNKSI